ncbi:mediator of RNA polymerase II transcription subunit 15-like [Oratosquilla oratoria]|uniref:mediator of RNA polymerase II transcription subunit 15-like n=1 Tax=Oratosquilla oratoria TaxID=337810 RepID=UPI003F768B6F
MTEDWKTLAFRQKVVHEIEEKLKLASAGIQQNAQELENQIFQKAKKREEYVQHISQLLMRLKEVAAQSHNANHPAPQINAILAGQNGPANNPGGPSGPGGSGPGNNSGPMMTGQGNMGGGMAIGPRMVAQPGMQTGMGNQGNDLMSGYIRQRLSENQIRNLNQKQVMTNMNTIAGPTNQMGPMGQGTNQMANQMGPMANQMVRSGTGMQPNVPSPGFPNQGVARMNTPSSTNASPAPAMGMCHVNNMSGPGQVSPVFIAPSPSSTMVHSPAGCGIVRSSGMIGAPSPGGGMINTPGQPGNQQPSPAGAGTQVDDRAYIEKVRQLSRYVEPLRRMIQRIGSEDTEKMGKMKKLLDILLNPQRRMPIDTLLKCEQVLEKLEIHREMKVEITPAPQVPGKEQSPVSVLTEAVSAALKTPCGGHTLHRTLTPALNCLLGPNLNPSPPKKVCKVEPIQHSPETPNISDVVQGEVARLDARFKVSVDCQQPPGSDDLTLICHLDDPNLPSVPPVSLTVPSAYPDSLPTCDLPAVDYNTTDFLKRVKDIMTVCLQHQPHSCTITMMLSTWEMSVRQACSPKA